MDGLLWLSGFKLQYFNLQCAPPGFCAFFGSTFWKSSDNIIILAISMVFSPMMTIAQKKLLFVCQITGSVPLVKLTSFCRLMSRCGGDPEPPPLQISNPGQHHHLGGVKFRGHPFLTGSHLEPWTLCPLSTNCNSSQWAVWLDSLRIKSPMRSKRDENKIKPR